MLTYRVHENLHTVDSNEGLGLKPGPCCTTILAMIILLARSFAHSLTHSHSLTHGNSFILGRVAVALESILMFENVVSRK